MQLKLQAIINKHKQAYIPLLLDINRGQFVLLQSKQFNLQFYQPGRMKKEDEEISFATNKKNMLKFKLVFVGDQAVGKSSIINRFIKNQFDPAHNPTVGIDFVSKNINVNGTAIRLQLWDTAGQQRFRSLIPGYLRDSQAAFVIFDVSNSQSYESIPKWIDFVKQSRGQDALIYVIGNKCDLQESRMVQSKLAKQKMKQMGIKYFEVSAKTGIYLQQIFKQTCSDLLKLQDSQGLNIQMQKSKYVNSGMTKQADRFKAPVDKNSKTAQLRNSKLVNPKSNPRIIKQKNCC